jgi:predicted permease
MFFLDLRQAARSLRRNPGFLAAGIACLGLALALCTTTFAILDAVVNPYVPYADPDRLFFVNSRGDGGGGQVTAFDRYAALRDGAQFHQEIGAYSLRLAMVRGGSGAEQRLVASVTPNLFSVLGVKPVTGRVFSVAPDSDDDDAAVISYDLWNRMFERRSLPDARLSVDDRTYAVIGVMPRGVLFDVWLRMPPGAEERGAGLGWVAPVVRLKPGVSVDRADSELRLIESRLEIAYGTGDHPFLYQLRPARPDPLRLREIHAAMAGAAIAVLLIACANLANLMLARGIQTRRDVALRKALGAGKVALAGQVLAEAVLIAAAGGAVGLLLSVWAVDILRTKLPYEVRFVGLLAPHLSWRVFVFALTATTGTLLLFGLVPAIRASDVDVTEPLKESAGTTTGRGRRRYSGLVIGEVGLSMVLLMGAALLARAAEHVGGYEFGFNPTNLYRVGVTVPAGASGDSVTHAFDRLLEPQRWGGTYPTG